MSKKISKSQQVLKDLITPPMFDMSKPDPECWMNEHDVEMKVLSKFNKNGYKTIKISDNMYLHYKGTIRVWFSVINGSIYLVTTGYGWDHPHTQLVRYSVLYNKLLDVIANIELEEAILN